MLTSTGKKRKKAVIWVSLFGVVVVSIIVLLTGTFNIMFSSDNNKLTTDTWSYEFKTLEEKVSFLKKYLVMSSEVNDTEYHILFQDNSGIVPGPSDWDIKVALMINKDNLDMWLNGYDEISPNMISLSWWDELKLSNSKWHLSSVPKFYKRPDELSHLVLYKDEGIVLKYITTQVPIVED